jgi:citrate synthase
VYSAVSGGVGALYGPLHGGANEAVLRMLERIGSTDNIPGFIEGVKNRKEKLFGFGHRSAKSACGASLSGLDCKQIRPITT